MTSINLQLARTCRDIRIDSGLSKRQFARIYHIDYYDLDKYEKNVLSMPTEVILNYLKLRKEQKNDE